MKTSTNLALNIPEGSDIFNYDTFLKQNFEKIDTSMMKVYNAKNLGLKGDGTNESSAMNTILTDLKNKGNRVVLRLEEEKTYRFDSTITLDVSRVTIDGRYSKFDFSGNTGVALRLTAQDAYFHNGMGLTNLELFRTPYDSASRGSTIGILYGEDTPSTPDANGGKPGVAHINLTNVSIWGFYKGEEYRINSYLVQHHNVDIFRCTYGIYKLQWDNSGENFSYFGGAIFNNTHGIYTEEGDFHFFGTSLDYQTSSHMWAKGGGQIFFQGFIERRDKANLPTQFIQEDTGVIVITNTRFTLEFLNDATFKLFKVAGSGGVGITIRDSFYSVKAFRSDGTQIGTPAENVVLTDGAGMVDFQNTRSFDASDFNHYFLNEASSTNRKSIDLEVVEANGTITGKYSSPNTNITQDLTTFESGTFSWKIDKTTNSGITSKVRIYVPLRKNSNGKVGWRIRGQKLNGAGFGQTQSWASVVPFGKENTYNQSLTDSGGATVSVPTKFQTHLITKTAPITGSGSMTLSTGAWSWGIQYTTGTTSNRPMWANYYIIDFDLTALGPITLFLDRLEFFEY